MRLVANGINYFMPENIRIPKDTLQPIPQGIFKTGKTKNCGKVLNHPSVPCI